VIILEDDLEMAVDALDWFAYSSRLVAQDESLLGASAYADAGQTALVADEGRALRSDFFPGLGWMLPRRVWEELGSRWPNGYWDDWLREPP